MATERVQSLASLAVSGVDVTVSGAGADQDGSSALWTLHEGQVSDGAIMHAELQVRACQLRQQTPELNTANEELTPHKK